VRIGERAARGQFALARQPASSFLELWVGGSQLCSGGEGEALQHEQQLVQHGGERGGAARQVRPARLKQPPLQVHQSSRRNLPPQHPQVGTASTQDTEGTNDGALSAQGLILQLKWSGESTYEESVHVGFSRCISQYETAEHWQCNQSGGSLVAPADPAVQLDKRTRDKGRARVGAPAG
jgi:hypothetical protein